MAEVWITDILLYLQFIIETSQGIGHRYDKGNLLVSVLSFSCYTRLHLMLFCVNTITITPKCVIDYDFKCNQPQPCWTPRLTDG